MAKKRKKSEKFEDPHNCKKVPPYDHQIGDFLETHMGSLFYIKGNRYDSNAGEWWLEILYLRLPFGGGYREEPMSIRHDFKASQDFLQAAYKVDRPKDLPAHFSI